MMKLKGFRLAGRSPIADNKNDFFDLEQENELIAYLSDAIIIKSHKIKTRSLQLPKNYIKGFVGEVSLQLSYRVEPLLAKVANLLIQYAQFANTDIKSRLGMGKTEVNVQN